MTVRSYLPVRASGLCSFQPEVLLLMPPAEGAAIQPCVLENVIPLPLATAKWTKRSQEKGFPGTSTVTRKEGISWARHILFSGT